MARSEKNMKSSHHEMQKNVSCVMVPGSLTLGFEFVELQFALGFGKGFMFDWCSCILQLYSTAVEKPLFNTFIWLQQIHLNQNKWFAFIYFLFQPYYLILGISISFKYALIFNINCACIVEIRYSWLIQRCHQYGCPTDHLFVLISE